MQQTSFSVVKTENISPQIINQTVKRCPLSPLLFNIVLVVLAMTIREKRNKRYPNGKRKTMTADDLIVYIENVQDAKRKLLELINTFGTAEGYKINTEKSLAS